MWQTPKINGKAENLQINRWNRADKGGYHMHINVEYPDVVIDIREIKSMH